MDTQIIDKICESIKDHAVDCIPKDATDDEVLNLFECLQDIFENMTVYARKRMSVKF